VDYIHDRNIRNKPIKYTDNKIVFLTERHAHSDFSYHIPVLEDGFYVFISQFSEVRIYLLLIVYIY